MKTNYDIGIVCALPKEYAALELAFNAQEPQKRIDKKHFPFPYKESNVDFGNGTYKCVFAITGKKTEIASARVSQLIKAFKVPTVIITGIAAGVPNPKNGDDHVRLGDIVVSTKVKNYLSGTFADDQLIPDEDICEAWPRLVRFVEEFLSETMKPNVNRPWDEIIDQLININPKFKRPDTGSSKDEFQDENGELISKHPSHPDRIEGKPIIHLGNIGSANALMKDPRKRTQFARQHKLIAFEMEGSGVATAAKEQDVQFLLIKGVCDYGDRTKSDFWQRYASLISTAFAKALLLKNPLSVKTKNENILIMPTQKAVKGKDIFQPSIEIAYSQLTYELKDKNYYTDIWNSFPKEEKDFLNSRFYYKRPSLTNILDADLKSRGLVIVEGPQLSGKTLLIKNYVSHIDNCDLIDIKDYTELLTTTFANMRKQRTSVLDIYANWGSYILGSLIEMKKIPEKRLTADLRMLLHQPEEFKSELKRLSKKNVNTTRLELSLQIIERQLNQCGYDGMTLLTIHLDDLHNYLDETLYTILLTDVLPLFQYNYGQKDSWTALKKIKLILATRYFPGQQIKHILRLSNMDMIEIKNALKLLNENWNENLLEEIAGLLFKSTSGYVWFFNRFIGTYLKYRAEQNSLHPLQLSLNILNNKDLWLSDSFLYNRQTDSSFIQGYIDARRYLRIFKNYDVIVKSAEEFFQLNEFTDLSLNDENYRINSLLLQTGILTFRGGDAQDRTGVVKIGNEIIRSYFLNKFKTMFPENYGNQNKFAKSAIK